MDINTLPTVLEYERHYCHLSLMAILALSVKQRLEKYSRMHAEISMSDVVLL